jgi:hypothetical protein
MRGLTIALLALLADWSAGMDASAAEPDPQAGAAEHWSLVLAGALGDGKALELHVVWRKDQVAGAFGRGPHFNRMPYAVKAADVRLAGGRLTGAFAVTIPFDGFVPRDRKSLQIDATVDAAATETGFEGTYKAQAGGESRSGTLTGSRAAPAAHPAVRRLALSCEDAVHKSGRGAPERRLGMAFAFKDGRSFAARLIPPGSITDVGLTATVESHALKLDGERLTGKLTGLIRRQGDLDKAVRYDWEFDGLAVGASAAGTIRVVEDGKPGADGQFVGQETAGAVAPGDALYTLTLHQAIPRHNFINVFLTCRGGMFLGGFATSPNFNNSIHTLDLTGLRLEGDRLRGALGVTIVPDAWIPKDRKPVPCRFELDAAAVDGEVAGRFTGLFGDAKVEGTVEGGCDRKPSLNEIAGLTFKVESGVFGRAFITMHYENGKLAKGNVWNNHSNLKGTVDKADLDWSDERIRGTAVVTVKDGGVQAGTYTCRIDGVLVGAVGAGAAETVAAEGRQKASTFWISIRPAEHRPPAGDKRVD